MREEVKTVGPEDVLAAVRHLTEMPGWSHLASALEDYIERDMEELLSPGTDHNRTQFLRGRMSFSDFILTAPERIIEQVQAAMDESNRRTQSLRERMRVDRDV